MPTNNLIEAFFQGGYIQLAIQAERRIDVVGGACWHKLVKEPESLLHERHGNGSRNRSSRYSLHLSITTELSALPLFQQCSLSRVKFWPPSGHITLLGHMLLRSK